MTLPDKNTGNPALYELYVTSNLWVAFLNNAASEQSARMNAMENASKNAGEILEGLKLQYNKARQARITMELIEIMAGASALWASSLRATRHLGVELPYPTSCRNRQTEKESTEIAADDTETQEK